MDRLSKIIREEINRFIISENISSLTHYVNDIANAVKNIGKITARNENASKFIYQIMYYGTQVQFALERCINANSLNESLSDYGISIPQELGGNMWYDMKNGYDATKNFLNGHRGNRYGNRTYNNQNLNQNTVKSEKLSVLLNNLDYQYNQCNANLTRYGITNQNEISYFENLFNVIKNLKQDFLALQNNAQGTNP